MTAVQKFVLGMFGLFVAACLGLSLIGGLFYKNTTPAFVQAPAAAPTQIVLSQPTNSVNYDGVTEQVVDDGFRKYRQSDWVGDDFDVEHTLPGKVVGPAIAEVKPFKGGGCFVVRVNAGETFTTEAGGAYWPAGSQNALVARWQHHVDEYLANYAGCSVYVSVSSFPNPTK